MKNYMMRCVLTERETSRRTLASRVFAVACFMLTLATLALFAGPQDEGVLRKKISLHLLEPISANEFLTFIAAKCGLTVEYADNTVKTNAVAFRLLANNLDAQCLVDWALRTLNAHATVTGKVMRVAAGAPPPLPSGEPASAIRPLSYANYPWTNSLPMRADQAIDYLIYVGMWDNYVMIPECDELRTFVNIVPNRRSVAELIEDVCSQAGLDCSLRGEVIYVQRKKQTEVGSK